MYKLQLSIVLSILSLMFVTFTHTASLPEAARLRAKRQSADVRTAEYLAWIALGGNVRSRGCEKVACGVVDVYSRVRRSSADQRIAELQALLALSSGRSRGIVVAHGLFDPDTIGKKKRDFSGSSSSQQQVVPANNMNDSERYNLLKALITKAAMDTTS